MKPALPPMTEAEWLAQVIQLAHICGWYCVHFRPAWTAKGWRTAVQGDGVGWPDLVCVRERVLWIETKADRGSLSPAQKEWGRRLVAAGQEWYCWRPAMWDTVRRVLA